jgi:hypothetical protein
MAGSAGTVIRVCFCSSILTLARQSCGQRNIVPLVAGQSVFLRRGACPIASRVHHRSKTSRERDRNVDPITVQTMHENGQRIVSLHIRARSVTMQKNRGSRISNQPGRKRLGVKRSQVQVLSPRRYLPYESAPPRRWTHPVGCSRFHRLRRNRVQPSAPGNMPRQSECC